jgi:hypothetical protein
LCRQQRLARRALRLRSTDGNLDVFGKLLVFFWQENIAVRLLDPVNLLA